MKPLPECFKSDGFAFRVIWREGRVALLGKRKPDWRPEIVCGWPDPQKRDVT